MSPDPMADRDVRQLHPPSGLRPGGWWACQHPERPPVADVTAFDFACVACCIAADAVRRRSPVDVVMTERTRSGVELGKRRSLSARLSRLTTRRDQ